MTDKTNTVTYEVENLRPPWWKIVVTYYWSAILLFAIPAITALCKQFLGDYPFDLSLAVGFYYNHYGWLFNEFTLIASLFIFSLWPVVVAGGLLWIQHRRHRGGNLSQQSPRVRFYFATIIVACYLASALPTFACRTPFCNFIPLSASLPGLVMGLPLSHAVNDIRGGLTAINWNFLTIFPNAIMLWLGLFYFLTPKANLPGGLRQRWMIVVLTLTFILSITVILVIRLEKMFIRLSDEQLSRLIREHVPASPPEDFELQIGDIILHRHDPQYPLKISRELMAMRKLFLFTLAKSNLTNASTYCGDEGIISANSENLPRSWGINTEAFHWIPYRTQEKVMPDSLVLRHPDPKVGADLCYQLRAVATDGVSYFGLDMFNKRNAFTCSSLVLYHLNPRVKNFDILTADAVLVYLLENEWNLINWNHFLR